jgi:biopolymer transport protein ExbB/biopolymer transport protein TolQ
MWLLLILSIFSIGAMIERLLYFRKRDDDIDELSEKLVALLETGDRDAATELLKKSPSVEAGVFVPAMRYLHAGSDAFSDAIESNLIRARFDLERGSTLLGTLGNNAPFIGLFGTVIGVIIAFSKLGASQSSESMNAVMGGIAESLVATGVGLFVAIPAVVAYNIIQKRIGDIEANVGAMTKDVTAFLKASDAKGGAGIPERERQSESGPVEAVRELAAAEAN